MGAQGATVRVLCKEASQLRNPRPRLCLCCRRDGDLVNVKYRRLGKKEFWQVKGAEKVLYGLDDIKDTDAGERDRAEQIWGGHLCGR